MDRAPPNARHDSMQRYKRQVQPEGCHHRLPLDFEHLIEYPQLCLFQVACIISEPPPLSDLVVCMPLGTALTRLLLSHRSPHRSMSVRLLVSCVYMRSGWSNPLMSFCQYYLVEDSNDPWEARRIHHHSRHHWRYL